MLNFNIRFLRFPPLKLQHSISSVPTSKVLNLNTSHVKLQLANIYKVLSLIFHLNTSHVKLQPGAADIRHCGAGNLNTSHVKLQP